MQAAAVPDVVAPPRGNPRFPLFDSLRAVAALSIVLVHVGVLSGMYVRDSFYAGIIAHLDIGVTIFFLLSGFLLYRPMLASRILEVPRTRLPLYARRRFLRIVPAYWLALTALAIFPGIQGVFTGHWWVFYGFLQNYPVYTAGAVCSDPFNCGIAPSWSLAIEVVFYIVLPFFAIGMAKLTAPFRGTRWLPVELGVLAAFSVFSILIQDGRIPLGHLELWVFYSPLGRAWWFALGMALAAISVWVEQRGSAPRALRWLGEHPGSTWLAAAALYLIPALFIFDALPTIAGPVVPLSQYVTQYVLFGVIAALLLLPAIFRDQDAGIPGRILRHRTLAWLGLISYGIFLWHFPILYALYQGGLKDWWPHSSFLMLAIPTLVLTILCASASYYGLERRLMRRK